MIGLNNSDIYFISYFDKNLNKNMVSFIKQQEDNFYNMPLDDYSNVGIFLEKLQLNEENPSIINNDIKLGCITSIKVLYDYIKKYSKVKYKINK